MTFTEFWLAVIAVCLAVIVVELSDVVRLMKLRIHAQYGAAVQPPTDTYGGWKVYKNDRK